MPPYLRIYLQCKRWGCMLVPGGLQDQPDWSFDLVDLAGWVFEEYQREANT